jgi:hypothetical protein
LEDSDEEEEPRPRIRMNRELRNLGIIPITSIPREVRNLNTSFNPTVEFTIDFRYRRT